MGKDDVRKYRNKGIIKCQEMISALKAKFKEKHSKAVTSSGWVGCRSGVAKESPPSPGLEGRSGWAHKPFQAEGTRCAGLEAAAGFARARDLRKSTGSRKEQAGDGRRRTRSVSAETDRSPTPRESRGAPRSRLGDGSCRLLLPRCLLFRV